jgi:signal transduction histidine kinase
LVMLVSREGLRNVRRHAGAAACKITIDLASCPFSVRVRDWGAGLPEGTRVGGGIELLQRMAVDVGCELGVASQPGLGTDLVLVGPLCTRDRVTTPGDVGPRPDSNSSVDNLTPAHAEHTAPRGQKSRVASRLVG